MSTYLLEVTVYWLVFYLLYHFLLRKETFFMLNRFYLLAALAGGLIFPVLPMPAMVQTSTVGQAGYWLAPISVTVEQMGYTFEEIVVTADKKQASNTGKLLLFFYLTGVVGLSIRFLLGLFQLQRLKRQSRTISKTGYQLVLTTTVHLPFSFFNQLYWSEKVQFDETDRQQILRHELTHIRQHHSADVVLLKLLNIAFWFNPFIWFYEKAIKNTHEYLADAEVVQTTAKKQYGQLLLRQVQSGTAFAFANNFNHSQLKKRFKMMSQKKSSQWVTARLLWALPVLAILMIAFTSNSKTTDPIDNNAIVVQDSVYNEVDQMPLFPGCEDIEDDEKRRDCATDKLLMHIYQNITYPELARETGTEGVVVARFVIDETGKTVNSEIIRSIGNGCDVEVMRVVNAMPLWNPGIHQGKKVSVYISLPIKFKLEGDPGPKKPSQPDNAASSEQLRLKTTPNPSAGLIQLNVNAKSAATKIYVSDVTGKILWQNEYADFSGHLETTLDLKAMGANGMTLVTIQQDNLVKTEKVLVQ